MKILLFGQLADICGGPALEVPAAGAVDDLKHMLEERFEKLRQVRYMIAVNRQVAQGDEQIAEGDTIALLPPFSGG